MQLSDAPDRVSRGLQWNKYHENMHNENIGKFDHIGWDNRMSTGTDTTYSCGDSSSRISSRMCPYGIDITNTGGDCQSLPKFHVQELTFIVDDLLKGDSSSRRNCDPVYTAVKTFALTFKSRTHESFTTVPIVMDPLNLSKLSNDIMTALLRLPNSVIDGVQVYSNQSTQPIGEITPSGRAYHSIVNSYITFTGPSVQGPQYTLTTQCTFGISTFHLY